MTGFFLNCLDGTRKWIQFKYERLSNFFNHCERMTHVELICEEHIEDSLGVHNPTSAYGPWLRPN